MNERQRMEQEIRDLENSLTLHIITNRRLEGDKMHGI